VLPPETRARLARNVAASKLVRELLDDLIPSLLTGELNEERFWALMAEEVAQKSGQRLESGRSHSKMPDKEARGFEQRKIPFGPHQGKLVSEVDPDYWGLVTENEFMVDLRRYLRSDRYRSANGLFLSD
jgi:hypothetical protein